MTSLKKFDLQTEYQPTGDQPVAIETLVDGFENGLARQTLLGVTGSGKTFTVAKVIEKVQPVSMVTGQPEVNRTAGLLKARLHLIDDCGGHRTPRTGIGDQNQFQNRAPLSGRKTGLQLCLR